MNHSSIEFVPMPEDAGQQIRRFFRVPLDTGESISVLIASVSYPVSDISLGGISILLEDNQAFEIGADLPGCKLHFKKTVLSDLTGRIRHCSPSARGSDLWQFGIQWLHVKESQKKALEQILLQLKKSALALSKTALPEETDEER
ncbi:MAG: PilZ domain-containing protein [Desulfotignum sp.]|jgi:c-di-GMP-binding flagellar brake protein YcgR|nr:PilZ domain-containing protein [Desulfotignum sp.]